MTHAPLRLRRILSRWLVGACLALAAIGPASAQTSPPADPNSRSAVANSGTVGVVSGGIGGTYVRIAADLSSVLDDGDRLRVLPIVSKGSVQNIADILFLHGVDIGIVQSDALAYVQQQHMFPGVGQSIQYIAKLYEEEVHVLARSDIAKLDDLAGKVVNVDNTGSGSAMTASLLFGSLGLKPTLANDGQDVALEKLRRGEIAAMVFVVGKPALLFGRVDAGSGLHFLPIPLVPALAESYLPSRLDHAQYPALIAEGAPVDTVAVGAVMAVFAWQPGSDRYRKVARFTDAFFGKFQQFLQPPRHPKWREVNLAAQVPGWKRFPAAQEWLQRQAGAAASSSPAGSAVQARAAGACTATSVPAC
ncbi:MAG: TAXI family TRAP transporter solute-binding subunit [Acetobacteraceae bacterium]|nr:TAXI family TRAP transporter solute-binding subunit [Acetobacteraceae bacterium]